MPEFKPQTKPNENAPITNLVPKPNYENRELNNEKIADYREKIINTPLKSTEELQKKELEYKMKDEKIRKDLEKAYTPYQFAVGKVGEEISIESDQNETTPSNEVNSPIMETLRVGKEVIFKNPHTGKREEGYLIESINPETKEINVTKETNIGGGLKQTIKPDNIYDSFDVEREAA